MSDLVYNKGFIDAISKLYGKGVVLKFVELKDSLNLKTSYQNLPSGDVVGTSDIQTLTNKTIKVYGATDYLGSASISNNAGSQADPAAMGSSTVVAADAGETYSAAEQTLINEIKGDYNNLRADVIAIRTALIGAIDYCDTLKTTLNALLAELRKSGGCGVIS